MIQPLIFENHQTGTRLEISPMPLRKVVRRSSTVINGRFVSALMNETIDCESPGELTFCRWAELDPDVTLIRAQSLMIPLPGGGVHYPDFSLIYSGRLEVHEIKSDRYADRPDVQLKAARAAQVIEDVGGVYSLTRYSALNAKPARTNLETVIRYLHYPVSEGTRDAMLRGLGAVGRCSISDLARLSAAGGGDVPAVYWLIANCGARVDYWQPRIDEASEVYLPSLFIPAQRLLPFCAVAGAPAPSPLITEV